MDFLSLPVPPHLSPPQSQEEAVEYYKECASFWRGKYLHQVFRQSRELDAVLRDVQAWQELSESVVRSIAALKGVDNHQVRIFCSTPTFSTYTDSLLRHLTSMLVSKALHGDQSANLIRE